MTAQPAHDIVAPEYPDALPSTTSFGIQTNYTSFTLAAPITATDLVITVVEDVSTAPDTGMFTIEGERIRYASVNYATKEFTVASVDDRGFDASTAAAHDAGVAVKFYTIAWHHNKLVSELRATQSELGTSGTPGSFLRRDGTATLTGEWDVGNQNITNVQNLDVDGTMTAANIVPQADNTHDLGSAALRWRDVYVGPGSVDVMASSGDAQPTARLGNASLELGAGGVTAPDVSLTRTGVDEATLDADLIVTGDLTVNGAVTSVNSTTTAIDDNKITLNDGEAGVGVSTLGTTSGLEIDRGTLPNAELVFDEVTDVFRTSYDGGVSLHTLPEVDRENVFTANQKLEDNVQLVFGTDSDATLQFTSASSVVDITGAHFQFAPGQQLWLRGINTGTTVKIGVYDTTRLEANSSDGSMRLGVGTAHSTVEGGGITANLIHAVSIEGLIGSITMLQRLEWAGENGTTPATSYNLDTAINGKNGVGEGVDWFTIRTQALTLTDGAEDARVAFRTVSGGVQTNAMTLRESDILFERIVGASSWTIPLTTGNFGWKSGTNFFGTFDHDITAARTWTFPDLDGTVPLLERANTWTVNQKLNDDVELVFGTGSDIKLVRETDEVLRIQQKAVDENLYVVIRPNGTPVAGDTAIHVYHRNQSGGQAGQFIGFGANHAVPEYLFTLTTEDTSIVAHPLDMRFITERVTAGVAAVTNIFTVRGTTDLVEFHKDITTSQADHRFKSTVTTNVLRLLGGSSTANGGQVAVYGSANANAGQVVLRTPNASAIGTDRLLLTGEADITQVNIRNAQLRVQNAVGIDTAFTFLATAATKTVTFPDANIIVSGSATALTIGRVPFATTGGILTDDADLTFDGTKLALATQGSTGGILIGGDVQLYRGAANILYVPDAIRITGNNQFQIEVGVTPTNGFFGNFNASGSNDFGISRVGQVLQSFDVTTDVVTFPVSQIALELVGSSGGVLIGGDAQIYRGAANRLDVATGDTLNLVSGNLGVGTATFGTSANNVMAVFIGTEPTTSPIDTVQIYAVDNNGAGTATMGLRTEQAVNAQTVADSTHTLRVRINGVVYGIMLTDAPT